MIVFFLFFERNKENPYNKPFNDLILQFLEEILGQEQGFENAWSAISHVWDEQPQVGSFDLTKHEFKNVWDAISIDKKLHRSQVGSILEGRKKFRDQPALLKFIRQLARYTKTRVIHSFFALCFTRFSIYSLPNTVSEHILMGTFFLERSLIFGSALILRNSTMEHVGSGIICR